MQKLISQRNCQKDRLANFLAVGLLLIVGALLVVKVVIANHSVGSSEKLHDLDSQIVKMENENEILAEEIRTKESLLSTETEAQKTGFVKNNKFTYLQVDNPVALGKTFTEIR